jgi:hypothetical protein
VTRPTRPISPSNHQHPIQKHIYIYDYTYIYRFSLLHNLFISSQLSNYYLLQRRPLYRALTKKKYHYYIIGDSTIVRIVGASVSVYSGACFFLAWSESCESYIYIYIYCCVRLGSHVVGDSIFIHTSTWICASDSLGLISFVGLSYPPKAEPHIGIDCNVPKKKNEKSIHPASIMHNENNQKKSMEDGDDRHEMIRNSITTRSHPATSSFRPPSSSTVAPTAGNSNVRIDTDDDDDDDEIWTLSKAYQSAQVRRITYYGDGWFLVMVVVVCSHPTFDALFFILVCFAYIYIYIG